MKTVLTILVTGLVLSIAAPAGEPARPMTAREVMQLTVTASTPADHLRLANYFELKARALEAEAKEHAEMAVNYAANPTASETKRPGASDTKAHCKKLSQDLMKAAADARSIAQDHQAMAKR